MLKIGITTRSYSGIDTASAAKRMSEAGFTCTELCFTQTDISGWTYNGRGKLDGIDEAFVARKANIYRAHGVEVVSLGLFTDLRSPDEAERSACIEYAKRYIDFAAAASIPWVASECGFTPGKRGVNADTYEADFSRIKETLGTLAVYAAKKNVGIALEGCVLDVVPSPKRESDLFSQLRAEYGVDNVKALLDPANFIAAEDEEGMFRHLAGKIAYFHGKDRFVNATYGINLGEGDINWARFFALLRKYEPDTPFVLEYCNADNAADIKARAEKYYTWAY
jgi:sugar phosphate isomerase/epimerase